MSNKDFKSIPRRKTAWVLVGLVTLMLLAGSQTALAVHVPAALDVPTLWTPMPNDGYLEFINPVEHPLLVGVPVFSTPPGVIMTEEYTGYTLASGVDIIEVGDSDVVAGDRADFDWVQENRGCETGGPCFNPLPVNHPGMVGAMGWTVGSPETSPHVDPGTGGAHGHSVEEVPAGPLPFLPNETYTPRFFRGVDVFSIISEGQDSTLELSSPGGRDAALDYVVDFGNTITGFSTPGVPVVVFAPGWTAATTIDDFVARWVPSVPGLYNVVAIEPAFDPHDQVTEIDAVKAWGVPEPSSICLALAGFLGASLLSRRRCN
ncbi:MAG: hypothetical protein L0228_14020 [Planctomycetes bacterium]|nr:hypothetical protein [Planctomycetota bacterium]